MQNNLLSLEVESPEAGTALPNRLEISVGEDGAEANGEMLQLVAMLSQGGQQVGDVVPAHECEAGQLGAPD